MSGQDSGQEATTAAFGSPEHQGVAFELEPTEFDRGDQVGDYMILSLLGRGGMGVVYLAYDPKLERKVALKLLRRGRAGDSSAPETMDSKSRSFVGGGGLDDATVDNTANRRLVHEAQSMARLAHPNVVAVYQVGEVDARVFIAMEYIEGATLKEWMETTKPSSRELLNVLIQAGRGLQAAHEAGLVHRDFKGANVLIGKDGRVCVTDFGLASSDIVEDGGAPPIDHQSSPSEPSRSGRLIGTPRYMAPEQHLRQRTDARSDQFSFCVTLYYAIFGVWPFSGDTYKEYADAVVHGRVNHPPIPRRYRWLRPIIQRGLNVDADRRHPSMGHLLAELDRKPTLRRNLAISGAVLALAGAAWFFMARTERAAPCGGSESHLVGVWDKGRAESVRKAILATRVPYAAFTLQRVTEGLDHYAAQWAAMHKSTCEATRVLGEQSEKLLDLRMACLDRMKGELGTVVDLISKVDAETIRGSLETVDKLSPVNNCARSESLSSAVAEPSDPQKREHLHAMQKALDGAKAELNLGKYKASLGHLSAIAPDADKLGYPPLQAEQLLLRGQLEWRMGELRKSEATLMESAAAAEQGRDDDKRAVALVELTYVVGFEEGRALEGLTWAKMASGTLSRVAPNERLSADFARNHATVLYRAGRYEDALQEAQHACVILRRLLGENHRDVADCLTVVGTILQKLDRNREALDIQNQALAVAESALGQDHPALGDFINNTGNSYAFVGEPAKAAAMYDRALGLYRRSLGPEHPQVAVALSNLGTLAFEQKDYSAALPFFSNALAIEEKALGAKDLNTAETLSRIGDTYLQMGQPQKAVAPLERAWAVHADRPSPPPEVASVAFSLARALSESKASQERALVLAHRARELAATAEAGDSRTAALAEIDDWLAQHPPGHR